MQLTLDLLRGRNILARVEKEALKVALTNPHSASAISRPQDKFSPDNKHRESFLGGITSATWMTWERAEGCEGGRSEVRSEVSQLRK